MSSNTANLGLLKKDPIADANDTFNIETMLNENWDRIDEAFGTMYGPKNKPTPEDLAAWAENAPVSTDCDVDIKARNSKVFIRKYNANTLNSPYKTGAVSYSQGIIITYAFSSSYATQTAFAGGEILSRNLLNSEVSPWSKTATTDYVDALEPTAIGALKLYHSLDEVGITKGSETIASIVSAMSNYSMLILNVNTESDGYNIDTYPAAWGLLTIKKLSGLRTEIDFMDVKSSPSGFYKKSYRSGVESEWIKLATTDYAVSRAGDEIHGNLGIKGSDPTLSLTDTDKNAQASFKMIGNQLTLLNRNEANSGAIGARRLLALNNSSAAGINAAIQLGDIIPNDDSSNTQKWYNVLHTGNVTSGTADITAGTTALATGAQYHVYE